MWAGSVRRIHAVRRLVQFQILASSPHSVTICWMMSGSPQWRQSGKPTRRILCKLAFVGKITWITTYQFILTVSVVQHACRLFHILSQSADGWSCIMRITRGSLLASTILPSVQCTLLRNVRVFTLLVGFYIRQFLDVGTQVVEGVGNPSDMGGFLSSRATASIAAIPPSWFPRVALGARFFLSGERGI